MYVAAQKISKTSTEVLSPSGRISVMRKKKIPSLEEDCGVPMVKKVEADRTTDGPVSCCDMTSSLFICPCLYCYFLSVWLCAGMTGSPAPSLRSDAVAKANVDGVAAPDDNGIVERV